MSHMVIYRGSDGQPGYHEVDELGVAISYVENLRNREGVEQARIFRMEEVSFEFRPYYRVEIGDVATEDAGVEDATTEDAATTAPLTDEDETTDPLPAEWSVGVASDPAFPAEPTQDGEAVGSNVRRGLFGR